MRGGLVLVFKVDILQNYGPHSFHQYLNRQFATCRRSFENKILCSIPYIGFSMNRMSQKCEQEWILSILKSDLVQTYRLHLFNQCLSQKLFCLQKIIELQDLVIRSLLRRRGRVKLPKISYLYDLLYIQTHFVLKMQLSFLNKKSMDNFLLVEGYPVSISRRLIVTLEAFLTDVFWPRNVQSNDRMMFVENLWELDSIFAFFNVWEVEQKTLKSDE